MGKASSKRYIKDSLIKLSLAGMLAFQTMAPSVLTVVTAQDGSEVIEPTTEVVEAPVSEVVEEPEENFSLEEIDSVEKETSPTDQLPVEGNSSSDSETNDDAQVTDPENSEESTEETEETETEVITKEESIKIDLFELLLNEEGVIKYTDDYELSLAIKLRELSKGDSEGNYSLEIYSDEIQLNQPESRLVESDAFYLSTVLNTKGEKNDSSQIVHYITPEGNEVYHQLQFQIIGNYDVIQTDVTLASEEEYSITTSDEILNVLFDRSNEWMTFELLNNQWEIYQETTFPLTTSSSINNYSVLVYSLTSREIKVHQVMVKRSLMDKNTETQNLSTEAEGIEIEALDVKLYNTEDNKASLDLGLLKVEVYHTGFPYGSYKIDYLLTDEAGIRLSDNLLKTISNTDGTATSEFSIYDIQTEKALARYQITFNLQTYEVGSTAGEGYLFTDSEIDEKKKEVIEISIEDFARSGAMVKEIDNKFNIYIQTMMRHEGNYQDELKYEAMGVRNQIWPVNFDDGQVFINGDINYFNLTAFTYLNGSHSTATEKIYYKDSNGKVTEYEITLKIGELLEPERVEINFSSETDGQTWSLGNHVFVTSDFKERFLRFETAEGWFSHLETLEVNFKYGQYSHYVHALSETGEVKIYELRINPLVTDDDDIELHNVTINLSKNNQYALGQEMYYFIPELGETYFIGSYDSNSNQYSIKPSFDTTEFKEWSTAPLIYETGETNETVESVFEQLEFSYDTEDWGKRAVKRVRLIINLNNEIEVDEKSELVFSENLNYDLLLMDSVNSKPQEVILKYNDYREESIWVGYDSVGLYKDYYGNSTKDKFIQLNQTNNAYTLRSILNELTPGSVRTYSSKRNIVDLKIQNIPELITEVVEATVTLDYSNDKPMIISSEKFPNLSINASHGHDNMGNYWNLDYEVAFPSYQHDGIYKMELSSDSENGDSKDSSKVETTVNIKKYGEGERFIGSVKFIINFEEIIFEEKETLEFNLVQENANNNFAPQHIISEDGLVYLTAYYKENSYETEIENYYTQNFEVEGELTPFAKNNNYLLVNGTFGAYGYKDSQIGGYVFESIFNSSKDFGVLVKAQDSNIIYYYPVKFSVSELQDDNNENEKVIEISGVQSDFNFGMSTGFGKKFTYPASEFVQVSFDILLDKENLMLSHEEDTVPEDRYVLYTAYGERLPFIKLDELTYEVKINDFVKVKLNISNSELPLIEVTEIKLNVNDRQQESLNLLVGETISIKAIINPLNASNQSIVWESSNMDVLEIKNGVVRALAVGEAIVTATTHNGLSANISVKVTHQQLDEDDNQEQVLEDENYKELVKVSGPKTAIPQGVVLKVEPVERGTHAYQNMSKLTNGRMTMFDISLYNPQEGINVQPKGILSVSIKIPDGYNTDNLKVYHFDEVTGRREEIQGTIAQGYFTFKVSHFSYYVLVDGETEGKDESELPSESDESDESELPSESDESDESELPSESDESDESELPSESDESDESELPSESDESDESELPGDSKDVSGSYSSELTKGNSKNDKLPNTGENYQLWVTVLGFITLVFGAVLVVRQTKRHKR